MMKRILSLILTVAMLASLGLLLTSCGEEGDGQDVPVFLCGPIYDFDPAAVYTGDESLAVLSLMFEPLFILNAKGDVEKGLADSYEIVEVPEDGIYRMVITLKESYWSGNAKKITADDVVYAWRRILHPSNNSPAAPLLYDIKNAVAYKQAEMTKDDLGVTADGDELTIEFEGKVDYDAFLRNLTSVALSPVQETALDQGREAYWSKQVSTFSGNGPFMLRSLDVSAGTFTLTRNPYYYRDKESDTPVTEYVLPHSLMVSWYKSDDYDPDTTPSTMVGEAWEAFANEVEQTVFYMGDLPLEQRAAQKENVDLVDLYSTHSYLFNTNATFVTRDGAEIRLFDDYRVRLAFSMVIDRKAIAEKIVYAKPATGLIPEIVKDGNADESFREVGGDLIATTVDEGTLEAAKNLLVEAGFDRTAIDEKKILRIGEKINISYNNTEKGKAVAEAIAEAWSQLGFDVVPAPVTGVANNKLVESKVIYESAMQMYYNTGYAGNAYPYHVMAIDCQMYGTDAFAALCAFSSTIGNGAEWVMDPDDGAQMGAVMKTHITGFSDDYYNNLISLAQKEKNIDKRTEYLHRAESYLLSKMPIVPILFNQSAYAVGENVKGLERNGYGAVLFSDFFVEDYTYEAVEAPVDTTAGNKDEEADN